MKTTINRLIPQLLPTSGFRLYLQSELARRLSSNPQYSLRSFALQLGINHSTLSQLLRGKRALTPRMIKTLGLRLGLRPEEVETFVAREGQAGETAISREIRFLTMETVALLSDGSHRAILEMTSMEGFVPDTRWIARALDLTIDEVNMALSRLTRLGLLEMVAADRWIDRSEASASTDAGFAQRVIRRLSEQARRLASYRTIDTQSEDGVQGGVWPCPPEGHAMVVLYIAVDDVAAYVEKARQLGGSVIIPPQKLPEGDEMAVIHDPEGLAVGLFKPARP